WLEAEMQPLGNDRWTATVSFPANGYAEYTLCAWRDLFATWRKDTDKKFAAGLYITLELEEGRRLIAAAQARSGLPPDAAAGLADVLTAFAATADQREALTILTSEALVGLMQRAAPR